MSDWQKILHESVDTLDKLAERFGDDVIDVEALQAGVRQLPDAHHAERRSRRSRKSATRCGSSTCRRSQELDIVDGVIDSLDEDGDSPVPNITHRYPDRVLFLVSPVCATLLPLLHAAPQSRRPGEDPAQPVRFGVRVHPRAHRRSATSSCRAATR